MALTRLSWFNRIALSVLVVGTVLLLVRGHWITASIVAPAVPIMAWLALRSMKGAGSDYDRVNAAQPYDERDAAVITAGFSFLGQFVFIAQLALTLWALAVRPATVIEELARLLAIGIALGVGNWLAARRR